ncbi:Cas10/Cmr2 second palm domain-containing protein [Hippea sp. KM1]|uniref:Cas10/Cmr2 second palm domain-containing protein n=1 Tax=Hippea sp. KM1 TaxID=944481 RepID=UPI00046CFFA3|nr:type III-B CRISPR-associated protein Cas10/Cmr2 [Hippea sp. KM1]
MYYGITISPIVETISMGRKMAEIWAASYMFSYMMKNLASKLKDNPDVKFLVPHVEDSLFEKRDGGIGRFADRIIIETKKEIDGDLNRFVQEVKENVSELIADAINEDKNRVFEFINTYIRIPYIKVFQDFKNPIKEVSRLLNNIDYFECPSDYKDYLQRFLIRERILKSRLYKDCGKGGYESIAEIASKGSGVKVKFALDKEEDDYYKALKEQLKESEEPFLKVYKYIAIVHADGDNLSKVVEEKGKKTSEMIFNFTKEAEKILLKKDRGCNIVFMGGDDLLFFSPVYFRDKSTIFDLIDELREKYDEAFKEFNKNTQSGIQTSLSFGVSISYYKFPLYEALKESREALFAKAKSKKNAVCVKVRKHSGQLFEFTEQFDSDIYTDFKNLLKRALSDEIEFPHSFQYKLRNLKALIENNINLDNFFENFFNEEIHKTKFKAGLIEVKGLLEKYKNRVKKGSFDEEFNNLFSMLSMIKLLEGREDD